MKVSLRVILFTTFFHIVKATWNMVQKLEGATSYELFGRHVAMSSNGRHVAVGNLDKVLFYEKVGSGTYSKFSEYSEQASNLAISSTGTRLIHSLNVYDYKEGSWEEVDGYLSEDNSLQTVDIKMSSNGNRIAVVVESGVQYYVEAYDYDSETYVWTSIGRVGVELSSLCHIEISSDGNSIAIFD